jgi:predicted dehydrogenase
MIGAGKMAQMILPDFAACEGVELTTLVARDEERGKAFADEWGIPHVIPIDRLADADVDVVYVATPHHNHAELTAAALRARHGALVEKSFTMNAGEAEGLATLAAASGVFLMEAMWMRFNPAIRAAHDLIAAGAIGEPRSVSASFGRAVPFDRAHRLWDPTRGGGSLLDQAVYPLALADLVLGAPTSVFAVGSHAGYAGEDAGVNTEASMLLGYGDGRQAIASTSIRTALPKGAAIGGSEGLLVLEEPFWATDGFRIERPGEEAESFVFPREGNGYVPMLRAVREAVENGWLEHPHSPLTATLRVMRVLDAVAAQIAPEPRGRTEPG